LRQVSSSGKRRKNWVVVSCFVISNDMGYPVTYVKGINAKQVQGDVVGVKEEGGGPLLLAEESATFSLHTGPYQKASPLDRARSSLHDARNIMSLERSIP
jgi:hypothetical protein